MVSAVVLVAEEDEKTLTRSLGSVAWCGEVIVVRDGEGLGGLEALGTLGEQTKIFPRKLDGDFAAQRNFGLEKASGDWVLFVDADEEVPPRLAREIQNEIKDNRYEIKEEKIGGFYLKRRDVFWGREIKHGEAGNTRLLRLARKNYGRWRGRVHEQWIIDNRYGIKDKKMEMGTLVNPLRHYPHPTVGKFLKDINFYTEIRARELRQGGKKFAFWKVVVYPVGKFLQNYFWRLGFLDGLPGLVYAFMMSLHSLAVRVKMYED